MVICDCASASLPELNATRCGDTYGMFEVLGFVKLSDQQSGLTAETAIKVKSNWDAAMTATKVQISPMVKGWTSGGGDAVVTGEDTSADGMGEVIRVNPTTAEVIFRGIKAAQAANMEKLRCLAELKDLGVYMFTADGRVVGVSRVDNSTSTPVNYLDPIPVGYLFMGDRQMGNRDEKDTNTLNMSFEGGVMNTTKAVALVGLGGTTNPDTTTPWKGIDLLAVGTSNS